MLALSMARLGDALGNSILFIILPLYVAQMPVHWFPIPEPVRVGLLISLYAMVNSIVQPLMGALSDRIGRRKLLIQVGLVLMAAATLGYIWARHYTDLFLLRALQGIGVGITIPAAMGLMAMITVKETRGGAMGVYSTTRMIGFGAGPLIGAFVYERFGFAAAFSTGAAFVLLGLLLVQIWVAEVRVEPRLHSKGPFRIFDRELLSAGIVGAGFATFIMAADFSMLATLENQFNARLDQTALAFAFAFSALMFTRLLFQIPLGRLSDRIGRRPLIVGGLLLMAPATALLGLAATTVQLTGLRLVQGLASAGIAAPAFALAADLSLSGGEGRQMSILTMGFGLGLAVGPLAAGLLAVLFFELPFLVAGVLTLAAAGIIFRYVPETVGGMPTPLHDGSRDR
ncbi:MAG: MFS transporter [Gemmatimonadota bacterium]|nr:MAG: MFS transporter [Gemmatimonadota bacterium]